MESLVSPIHDACGYSSSNTDALNESNQNHNTPIISPSDLRVVGLQAMTDKVLHLVSRHPYTLDTTQFFRFDGKGTFYKGLEEVVNILVPILRQSQLDDDAKFAEMSEFLDWYSEVLKGTEGTCHDAVYELAEKGSGKAKTLLENTYMDCPKETPLFHGKRVIVTGSDTGIRRETALEFARRGANVVFHYPNDESGTGALSAVDIIKSSGGEAYAHEADFSDLEKTNRFARKAISVLGGVDVLINNAGVTSRQEIGQVSNENLMKITNINQLSPFVMTRETLPHMEEGGVIVFMGSNHAETGSSGHAVYGGTKAAVAMGYTSQMSIELAEKGIRVFSLFPGGVLNKRHCIEFPRFYELAKKDIPTGYWNNPIDVARGIAVGCSDQSNMVTGTRLVIDGGLSSKA